MVGCRLAGRGHREVLNPAAVQGVRPPGRGRPGMGGMLCSAGGAGHLRVALHHGRADLRLVGVVLVQVAAQRAKVAATVLARLPHGVYGHASAGRGQANRAGAQGGRGLEDRLG